ncbi:DUF5787 family protein [Haloarchaeobius sp. TZWSO28]|uniref:DUF5787 family protein n=1 Tax=Haloarchaeobius sp. TZWSO28 TaxID=3446119 RepID=UPI003EB88F31
MREFGFELHLCAFLERERDAVLARQLGGGVHSSRRVLDVVCVEPGPNFADRTAITAERIPDLAIESDIGPGRARYYRDGFDCRPDRARHVVDWATDIGFFERERRSGRDYVRQTCRYPDDWFGRVLAIENKPDLGAPGDLETQLRKDVRLGLVDEVVLATASHVTGAHLNRIPEEVGVWRFDPETLSREVIREPMALPVADPGVEIIDEHAGWTEVRIADTDQKSRARRRLAERAYGKGWRSYDFPGCAEVEDTAVAGGGGVPYCDWKGRVVDPGNECGPDCPGFEEADPPVVDGEAERDRRTPWVADPEGQARRQSGLDRFT